MMEMIDLAYAAGVIDCDGTIGIVMSSRRKGREYYTLRVASFMTEPEVPTWLHNTFGGGLYSYQPKGINRKRVYCWSLSATKATVFLGAITPYLKMKANQVEIALAFQKLKRDKCGGVSTPKPVREAQLILRNKLIGLHHANDVRS